VRARVLRGARAREGAHVSGRTCRGGPQAQPCSQCAQCPAPSESQPPAHPRRPSRCCGRRQPPWLRKGGGGVRDFGVAGGHVSDRDTCRARRAPFLRRAAPSSAMFSATVTAGAAAPCVVAGGAPSASRSVACARPAACRAGSARAVSGACGGAARRARCAHALAARRPHGCPARLRRAAAATR
jgi:hypothetical protein